MGEDRSCSSPRQKQSGPKKQLTWFISAAHSPIAVLLTRQLLERGDNVVAGDPYSAYEDQNTCLADLKDMISELRHQADINANFKILSYDPRSIGECQAVAAEANATFGRIDVLFCCNSEALIGTVEELAQSKRTQGAIHEQFSTNFFGPVNVIKSCLPTFREHCIGHIVLLSGITGHLGTPGLGFYCSSQWALEGYCDSLAYELAPFNIKVTIMQASIEVLVLTNPIVAAPALPAYSGTANPAPLSRGIISGLLNRLDQATQLATGQASEGNSLGDKLLQTSQLTSLHPSLPQPFRETLLAETVHALLVIGGNDNPPARHIVGHEGVASVKEKLRTVSEEMEEFVEVSTTVDVPLTS